MSTLRAYVAMARIDHGFKKLFILPGAVAVTLLEPDIDPWRQLSYAASPSRLRAWWHPATKLSTRSSMPGRIGFSR